MEYQEFVSRVAEKMRTKYNEMGLDYTLSIQQNEVRNKGTCTAVVIDRKHESFPCKPAVYMESSYEAFSKGMSLDEIVDQILTTVEKEAANVKLENHVFSKERILKNLRMGLIHKDKNQNLLAQMPHRIVADLALVYKYALGQKDGEVYTTNITNKNMASLGLTEEELYQAAMECRKEAAPHSIISMGQAIMDMGQMLGLEDDQETEEVGAEATILTTQDGYHGASCILYPEAVEELAAMKGGSFVLIPCSIHEWIVLPESYMADYKELEELVQTINCAELPEEDILSDHVYFYDVQKQELTVCGQEQEQTACVEEQEQAVCGEKNEPTMGQLMFGG